MRLVYKIGTGTFIERLANEIEQDYRRWGELGKSTRLESHSSVGVIGLMPSSEGQLYVFKCVNGHPQNTAAGLFGVLADPLPELTVKNPFCVPRRSSTDEHDYPVM